MCLCQEGLNLRLNSQYASTAEALFVDDNYAYVIGNTFDTTRIAIRVGIFYKINLESKMIEDSIVISKNPIEFDAISHVLHEANDTLHYFAYGEELRDTTIDNQNVYTHYHHFKYSLSSGEWNNKTFPAYNDKGRQFITHRDAYFTDSNIYASNRSFDFEVNSSDVLVTKLDYDGNVIWNNKMCNDVSQANAALLVDQEDHIIIGGYYFYISRDKRDGFHHLFLSKLDPSDGSIIDEIIIEEDVAIPRALIEDPNGGYIISAGDAEFQEGGRYPEIVQIIKINKELDSVVWNLRLSDTLSYSIFGHLEKFIFLGNNEFLAIGVSDMTKPFSHSGRIVKFTGDGELIFDKEIQHFDPRDNLEQRLTDIIPYKDGFIACGTILAFSDDFIIPRQQGWVVYIDGNGNTDISSSTDLITVDRGVVKVYPNPSSGRIFLEFEKEINNDLDYKIFSLDGIEISNGKICKGIKETNIDMHSSVPGSYILRLNNNDITITKLLQIK